MPSATATILLNVSAIQALCKGSSILEGSGSPSPVSGISGDLYLDIGGLNAYPYCFNLYGPKTTTWPVTSNQIPSITLTQVVSTNVNVLSAQVTSLSNSFSNSQSALSIANNNVITTLQVNQQGAGAGKNIAKFSHGVTTTLVVTNSATVGVLVDSPDSTLEVGGNAHIDTNLQVDGTLTVAGSCQLGPYAAVYTGLNSIGNPYSVLTTNAINLTLTELNFLSGYTAVFGPLVGNPLSPVRIHNTRFEAGSSNGDLFCTIDPTSAVRTMIVYGSIGMLSAVDINGKQLLGTRQVTPAKATSTSDIVAQFNTLLDRLTAHGLIR